MAIDRMVVGIIDCVCTDNRNFIAGYSDGSASGSVKGERRIVFFETWPGQAVEAPEVRIGAASGVEGYRLPAAVCSIRCGEIGQAIAQLERLRTSAETIELVNQDPGHHHPERARATPA